MKKLILVLATVFMLSSSVKGDEVDVALALAKAKLAVIAPPVTSNPVGNCPNGQCQLKPSVGSTVTGCVSGQIQSVPVDNGSFSGQVGNSCSNGQYSPNYAPAQNTRRRFFRFFR